MWRYKRLLFSPVVSRELLVSSRRAWTHWGRFSNGLGAMVVLTILAAVFGTGLGLRNGREPMVILFIVLFVSATVGGFRATFDCVSRERREGTLGLLFLTDLRSTTILFAKLVSSSFQNMYAIVAVLPVLAACFLAGGVTGTLFTQATLAVLSALFLSINVGLFQTCLTEDDHEAFSKSLRILFLFNVLPFFSPAWLLVAALVGGDRYFGVFVVPTFGMGLVYWFRACGALSSNWRGLRPSASSVLKRSTAAIFQGLGGRCGDEDPAYWIVTRYGDPRQVRPRRIGIAIVAGLPILAVFGLANWDVEIWITIYLVFMNTCKLMLWLAMCKVAPQGFAQAVKGGAVELLLTTPLTVRRLVAGAVRFLGREFGWAVGLVVAADLGMVLLVLNLEPRRLPLFLAWLWYSESVFLMGLLAMASVGVWMGLRHERYSQAVSWTVGYLILGSGVICFLTVRDPLIAWASIMGWFGFFCVLGYWRVVRFMEFSCDGANLTDSGAR